VALLRHVHQTGSSVGPRAVVRQSGQALVVRVEPLPRRRQVQDESKEHGAKQRQATRGRNVLEFTAGPLPGRLTAATIKRQSAGLSRASEPLR
jgi:hypothetical protein